MAQLHLAELRSNNIEGSATSLEPDAHEELRRARRTARRRMPPSPLKTQRASQQRFDHKRPNRTRATRRFWSCRATKQDPAEGAEAIATSRVSAPSWPGVADGLPTSKELLEQAEEHLNGASIVLG
jgi:hypothetical protein